MNIKHLAGPSGQNLDKAVRVKARKLRRPAVTQPLSLTPPWRPKTGFSVVLKDRAYSHCGNAVVADIEWNEWGGGANN